MDAKQTEMVLKYLNDQIIQVGNRQKDAETMLLDAVGAVRVHVAEKMRLQTILDDLHQRERDLNKLLPPKPETHGREFYEEIGHKGGSRVRALIQESKDHEEA
jgi:hypothetical protein